MPTPPFTWPPVPLNTLAALGLTMRSGYLVTGNPYIDPPASPDSWNDEFYNGDPALENRGWTVVNAAGTTLTRSGPVQPFDLTGPVGNTYWSSLSGSFILIQGAPGVQIDIYKTITLAAGDTYVFRMGAPHNFNAGASTRFNEVGFYGASGAALDNNNRVYNTVRDDASATAYLLCDVGRNTGGAFAGITGRFALGARDVRGVHFNSGTDHVNFMLGSAGGELSAMTSTGAPAAATLTRVGVRCLFAVAGSAVPQVWSMDYARKFPSNAWLAQ